MLSPGDVAMIHEIVLMLVPFMVGLAVSSRRAIEIFATLFALNGVLFAFATRQLEQPPIAAVITIASLSLTTFGLGWLAGAKLPRLQGLGLGGISLAGGAFCTALLAGALRPPVRHEKVSSVMVVEGARDETWDSLVSSRAFSGAPPLSMKLGMPTPKRCEFESEGLGSPRVCQFDEGRLEQRVTKWQPPERMQVELTGNHLPIGLVGFTREDTTLMVSGKQTHLLRTTEFDSMLTPAWLWRPVELWTVSDAQRYSLSGMNGRFVDRKDDGVPVRLTVKTNPPTEVMIVPPRGSGRSPLELGRTPIDEQVGAFVGDTVLLTNDTRGIRFEETIEYGQPDELKLIVKTFREPEKKLKGFSPE